MQPRLSLITLGVKDLPRAISFYEDGLGLPRVKPELEGVAFFDLGRLRLSLFPSGDLAQDAGLTAGARPDFPSFSLAHNVATKAEVDAVLAQATAAGAAITSAAQERFWGGYSGYFRDPDGFLWEIAYNPDMPELAAD